MNPGILIWTGRNAGSGSITSAPFLSPILALGPEEECSTALNHRSTGNSTTQSLSIVIASRAKQSLFTRMRLLRACDPRNDISHRH